MTIAKFHLEEYKSVETIGPKTSKSVMDLWFSEVAQAFQLWKLKDAQTLFPYPMNF